MVQRAGALAEDAFVFTAPSLLSVKEQWSCHAVSCNRVSVSSALQLLVLCLLPLAVILSLLSQMGCSLDMLCVTGMAVTPPQVILFSLKSALACTSRQVCIDKDLCVCVRMTVFEE